MCFTLIVILATYSTSFGKEKNIILPKAADIVEWIDSYDTLNPDIKGAREIMLRDKTHAFLVPLTTSRAVNSNSMAIVFPEKKQAKEISDNDMTSSAFSDIENVYDFDKDGVSEVEFSSFASNRGIGFKSYYIVQFDEANPIILHETKLSENSGCCGEKEDRECGGECDIPEISWKFIDINQDGIQDLIEEKTIQKGPDMDHLTTTKETAYYIFQNKKYTQVKDTKKLHLPQ